MGGDYLWSHMKALEALLISSHWTLECIWKHDDFTSRDWNL